MVGGQEEQYMFRMPRHTRTKQSSRSQPLHLFTIVAMRKTGETVRKLCP